MFNDFQIADSEGNIEHYYVAETYFLDCMLNYPTEYEISDMEIRELCIRKHTKFKWAPGMVIKNPHLSSKISLY